MNIDHPAHPDWICILNPEDDAKDPAYVPPEYVKELQKSLRNDDNKEKPDGSKY